jgi:hypothetical protein
MATGACGINCDVCLLKVAGICSTCGAGGSPEALAKMEAQVRMLGEQCPILACAHFTGIQYCPRDCSDFPCEIFQKGPYPFSEGFLQMQTGRRRQRPPARTPAGAILQVPPEYWQQLREKDSPALSLIAGFQQSADGEWILPILGRQIRINTFEERLYRVVEKRREVIEYPLLELVILVYLLNVKDLPPAEELIGVNDLKDAHFFQGPHDLKTEPLLEKYGSNPAGFRKAAEQLGGAPLALADLAYTLHPLPKIPLYFLLWEGDEDFAPSLTVLFDRTIEAHLTADAIWGVVNLTCNELLLTEMRP